MSAIEHKEMHQKHWSVRLASLIRESVFCGPLNKVFSLLPRGGSDVAQMHARNRKRNSF